MRLIFPLQLIKKSYLVLTFLFLIFTVTHAQQWVQTRGPGGGTVYDMLEKNGTILAATSLAVFRTTDNGDTWTRSITGLPPQGGATEYLAATTNNIFVAGFSGSVYKSADNGITWANMPDAASLFILDIFASHDTLYLGLYGGGVARSVNEGVTFELINTGFPASAYVVSFAQVGQYLFAGLSGNGGTVGIYRTPVNAINWTQMNNGFNSTFSIGDIATKGPDLFALTSGGLFRSTDLGNTWFQPLPGFNDFGGHLTVYNGDIYTTPDGGSVLKSINDGASWTPASAGLKPLSAFSYLAGSNGLFVGYERGIARTTNNAVSWDLKTRGLTNTSVTSLFADGNRLYATTRTTNLGRSEGVFFTDDGGQNWTPLNGGLLPNPEGKVIIKSGNNIILGTLNNGLFIKRPADAGFSKPPAGVSSTAIVQALISSGPVVLAGVAGEGEIYRSTDYGETWTQSNAGFRNDQEDQVYSLYNHNGVMYAGAFNALYKSTDLGLTWTNSYTGIYPGAVISGITSLGNDLYAVDNYTNGIYKSTNNGASWFNVNNGLPSIIKFNAIIAFNGILYAASDYGIYRSTDNGSNWADYNSGLLFQKASLSMAILNNNLFLGTDQTAVWGMTLGPLPITLQSFAAKEAKGIVNLQWKTSTEINGSHFDVQRSTDGQNFISIGRVNVSGNANGYAYKFDDVQPKKGLNFYRIAMIDIGGNKKYSGVGLINLKTPDKINMTVTPNPATTQIVLNVSGNLKGKASIDAYDISGRIIANLYTGEINGSSFSTTLNVSILKNGIYNLRFTNESESLTKKLLIQ